MIEASLKLERDNMPLIDSCSPDLQGHWIQGLEGHCCCTSWHYFFPLGMIPQRKKATFNKYVREVFCSSAALVQL